MTNSGENGESNRPLNDENDTFRTIFQQCDKNNDGRVCIKELDSFLNNHSDGDMTIPKHTIFKVHRMADENGDKQLSQEEFVCLITNKNFQDLMLYHINEYVKFLIPIQRHQTHEFEDGVFRLRSAREVVDGPEEEDEFLKFYTCRPPPLFIISISVFQIVYYFVDPYGEDLLYDPRKMKEFWRFFTYVFVHTSIHHLLMNILVQICLGIPLEMVNKWWRLTIIYVTGGVGGSMMHSVVERSAKLAGASGSVYAIMTAHVVNVIINWGQMKFPIIQLIFFGFLAFYDLGYSIYDHYVLNIPTNVGIMAHLGGAMSGMLVGIYTLRNIRITSFETYIWWIALTIYMLLLGTAILINLLVL